MEENEVYDLDDVIEEGLIRTVNSESSEEFCSNAKAVTGLIEVKAKEEQIQNEYRIRADESANESLRNDLEKQKIENDSKLVNRINPNTVITVGGGLLLTGMTMLYESGGHVFKFSDIGRIFMGVFTRDR